MFGGTLVTKFTYINHREPRLTKMKVGIWITSIQRCKLLLLEIRKIQSFEGLR
jgi:hypothetical protein